jgi:hypothetical protein
VDIILRIWADPTSWFITGTSYGAIADELGQGSPVLLDVAFPLQGQLVLSLAHAGSVALLPPWAHAGTHPGDNPPPAQGRAEIGTGAPAPLPLRLPALYLPSTAGATLESPGYRLPADTDPGALASAIKTAIGGGSRYRVSLASGLLVLNGAALAFAVICPATA